MRTVTGILKRDTEALKKLLPAEDILTFAFTSRRGLDFVCVYADPVTDKELLGEQLIRPLLGYDGEKSADMIAKSITSPEIRLQKETEKLAEEVLAGNPVLLWEGMDTAIVAGTKKVFVRAVAEPSTDVAVKGPREGFIEDVKINTSLVRRRLKTGELRIEMLEVGRRSKTVVAVCYLAGTSVQKTVDGVKKKLREIDIDIVPDSSYLTHFLSRE